MKDDAVEQLPEPSGLRRTFQDPGVRNYIFTGLAALAMVFVVMFQKGSDLGGLLAVLVGSAGLIFRWTAAPALFLLLLTYFLIFPYGLPPADENPFEIEEGRFRIVDMILVASVLVYLASHYRAFGLTTQAIPYDTRFPRRGVKPVRRPSTLIRPTEFPRLLYLVAGMIVLGQLGWWIVANVELDPTADFPFRLPERLRGTRSPSGDIGPIYHRIVILVGLLFFGTLLARLAFGYWQLRRMSADEGGMILQDEAWNETRRERDRLEKWRARARKRAVERAGTNGANGGSTR